MNDTTEFDPVEPYHVLEGLDGTQELIDKAAARVRHALHYCPLGMQKLSYLAEAMKLLNRSYSLVRSCYGPAPTLPTVTNFGYMRTGRIGDRKPPDDVEKIRASAEG